MTRWREPDHWCSRCDSPIPDPDPRCWYCGYWEDDCTTGRRMHMEEKDPKRPYRDDKDNRSGSSNTAT